MSFMNTYTEDIHEYGHVRTSTKILRVILDAEYKKVDLNKVMENQCQHMIETQRNELIKLLENFEEFFDGKTRSWKTDPLYFELKEGSKPIYSILYPVPKVDEEMLKIG